MNQTIKRISKPLALLLLMFCGMRLLMQLHAENPLCYWLSLPVIGLLALLALFNPAAKCDSVAKTLLWSWALATFWTHQQDVLLLHDYAGFGTVALWTSIFWLLLLPALLAFLPLLQYLARAWRNEIQAERLEHIAGLFLLQIVLWLLMVLAAVQLPRILVLATAGQLLALGAGFLLFLWVCSLEKAKFALTLLGLGFGLMAGSLAQLLQIDQQGWVSVTLWILSLIALIGTAFYFGWVFRGRPESEREQPEAESSGPTIPLLSLAESAENERWIAEYQRRSRLTVAERAKEDFEQAEADLLAQAAHIRQQTPEQRAQKLRAAIEAAEAREAADKWTRE